jgi:hypothetical protein
LDRCVNLYGSSHIADFGQSHKSLHDVCTIEGARCVLESWKSRCRIRVDTAGIPIAANGNVSVGVSKFGSLYFIV